MPGLETPEFVDLPGRRIFCVRHQPEGPVRASVVFAHPFGEEQKSAYHAFAEAARVLADSGFACLRFDFSGCGDSSGELDQARVDLWLEDLHAMIDLAAQGPAQEAPRFLVGLRLGAAIACRAAAARSDIAGMALWQPVVNGRAAFEADLRRVLIKQMMTDGASKVTREEMLAQLERGEGRIDLDGFPLTGALYRGIASLDLLSRESAFIGPVLLVQLSHSQVLLPEIQRAADAFRAAGSDVTLQALVSPPLWARIDRVDCSALAEKTASWLRARAEGGRA